MKTSSALKKYLKKRIRAIDALLEKPQRLFTAEDYHQLRVEIKKTKALFAILQFSTGKFDFKKYMQPFRPVFKEAGHIRELQLEKQTLQGYLLPGPFNAYFSELDEERKEDTLRFFSFLNKKKRKKLNKTLTSALPFTGYAKRKIIKKYAKRQVERITKLGETEDLQAGQIHLLRKKLKKFYYTERIFSPGETPFTKTESFQELLGKWHDLFVLENYLQKATSTAKKGTEEEKTIAGLKKLIAAKNVRLRRRIKKEIPAFLHSLHHS